MKENFYLYLEKKEWSAAWIHGGTIPVNLASKYKKDYRDGIFTPDENLVRNLNGIDDTTFNNVIMKECGIGRNSAISIKIGNTSKMMNLLLRILII